MDEIDKCPRNDYSEEDLFLCEVIGEDAELLYLDTFLRELFAPKGV